MNQYFTPLKTLALLLCSFLLFGCPYESVVPITQDGFPVPKELLGNWIACEDLDKQKDFNYYHLSSKDGKKIVLKSITNSETTSYSGHLSKINNVYFLNLKEEPAPGASSSPFDSNPYLIFRLRSVDQFYWLDELSTNISETFTTSADFQKFVEKHMNNELFYNSSGTKAYIKIKDKSILLSNRLE